MLLWTTLFSATVWMYIGRYEVFFQGIKETGIYYSLSIFPLIPLFVAAPLAGWLADMKLGNYGVFRIGSILLFLASVLGCVCVLVLESMEGHNQVAYIFSGGVAPTVIYSIGSIGWLSCLVTALQLGLDQMPEASAANISSFIAWFVCSLSLGAWFADVFFLIPSLCTKQKTSTIQDINLLDASNGTLAQLTILVPVLCTSVICSSLFICAPKWLIIEPKSPQSLKIIYQVLKFAAKHKAPINRSALTYWEDDIPSRIDLGKSKYGGPFTTEQVEDVKTVLKILVILLPLSIDLTALDSSMLLLIRPLSLTSSNCTSGLLYSLTYSPWLSFIIASMVYEFGVYPAVRNKLPNSLRQIGSTAFFILILNSPYLILGTIYYFHPEVRLLLEPWPYIVHSILNGLAILFVLKGVLEFVCAQAPYNMRGLLTGYTIFAIWISTSFGALIFYVFKLKCAMPSCSVIHGSISVFLSLIGFILYCVLARWYKLRVRDEDYSPQRVIEEVYDRYLSQVQ